MMPSRIYCVGRYVEGFFYGVRNMPDETKTGEATQAAAENKLGAQEAQAAAGQETGEEGNQAAAEKGQLDALKAERDKRQAAEQEAASFKAQAETLQQQMDLFANQTVKQMPKQAKSYFEGLGLEKYESPTAEQVEAYIEQYADKLQKQANTRQALNAAEQFVAGKADYAELVGVHQINGNWIPSAFFNEVLKDDPSVQGLMYDPRTARQIAYKAAKSFQRKQKLEALQTTEQEREAQQEAELVTSPQPASSVGGSSAAGATKRLDPRDPADRAKILDRQDRMLEGEFDT